MLDRFKLIVAAGALCLVAAPVLAQTPGLSKDEAKCQSNTGKTLAKFTGSKAKCIGKCFATQRKAATPAFSDCLAPYADATENACITAPAKGAEDKAGASIAKKCNVTGKDSCPECYSTAECNNANGTNPFVQSTETNIDAFPILVYCNEALNNTPGTKEEQKCEDGVSKALVKFVGSKTKCYDKCHKNMESGKIPLGSCNPPNPSDAATLACVKDPVKGAEAKAAASIDKVCATAGANPSCYVPAFDTGQEWVNTVEAIVDGVTPTVACGSPSGAFLN